MNEGCALRVPFVRSGYLKGACYSDVEQRQQALRSCSTTVRSLTKMGHQQKLRLVVVSEPSKCDSSTKR